jgi:epsin
LFFEISYCRFNQAKPKTDLEAKIYEVLSHKNWGSSSTLMNELARDTFDYEKFAVISQLMWEAMENQRPAAWRVVFKGLTLLEHLIKNGSERCVDDARGHGHSLKSLLQFNYYEGTIDRGLGVREKSKQILEILGDDERIREERQKARKLREKFGGSLGGAGGGGGATSNPYSGHGNDNWDRGGGGYGDGGIGSKPSSSGGRYDDDGGYHGRYDNEPSTSAASAGPAPTFASLSDETPKKTKGKKKKKESSVATTAAGSAAEVDLFSFDDPTPAPVSHSATAADDDFDNFQSAPGNSSAPSLVDPFAAPVAVQQPSAVQFDLFGGGAVPAPAQQPSFDAFGSVASSHSNPVMTGNTGMMMQQPPAMGVSNMMGFGNVPPSAPGMSTMNGMQPPMHQHAAFQAPDDDFGDFADATSTKKNVMSNTSSSNPMSKLISLDGLSKNNSNTLEDKLNQPIIANAAAATFVQEKDQIQATVKQSVGGKGSSMSFAGIDGLHKSSMMSSGGGQMPMMMMPPPSNAGMMGHVNPSVMGGSGGTSSSVIGMLDPNEMKMQKPPPMSAQGMNVMGQSPMMNNNTNIMYPSAGMPSMAMAMNSGVGMNSTMQQPQSFGMMPQQQTMMMNNPGYGVNMQGNPNSMQQQPGFSGMGGMGMTEGQPGWNTSGGMGQPYNGMNGPPMGGFR